MISVDDVRRLAIKAHGPQKYGDRPYGYHLAAVVAVAIRFGFTDKDILMACWLHDILEDTEWTPQDLLTGGVSRAVVAIVVAISDGRGQTRSEQKAAAYRKLRRNRKARIVKLFDRIANVEHSIANGPADKLQMYRDEHPEFERQLGDRRDAELEPMWQHLKKLLAA